MENQANTDDRTLFSGTLALFNLVYDMGASLHLSWGGGADFLGLGPISIGLHTVYAMWDTAT